MFRSQKVQNASGCKEDEYGQTEKVLSGFGIFAPFHQVGPKLSLNCKQVPDPGLVALPHEEHGPVERPQPLVAVYKLHALIFF